MARGNWKKLYRDFDVRRSGHLQVERSEGEYAREMERFDEWCRHAADVSLQSLADIARARAEEFRGQSGESIEVAFPSHPPLSMGVDGPWLKFLRLSLGDEEIHIYASGGKGGLPYVHFAHSDKRSGRLLSIPGGFIARGTDDQPVFRTIPRTETERSIPLDADDLVFRGFEILLMGPYGGRVRAVPTQ